MKILKTIVPAIMVLFTVFSANAQRIYYSEPDRDDLRQLKFEVMGKYGSNYLVYKSIRSRHFITVYDAEMKQKDKVELDFIPDRAINVDMFSNPEHSMVIYQFQKKNVVYCMGVMIDGSGKKIGEPLELDTTQLSIFSDNKIYSTIMSDDKQKLMVFKMKNRQRDDFSIQTVLLSHNLMPLRKSSFSYHLENSRESIADFYLDNDGNFLFSHVTRPASREYINEAKLVVLPAYADSVKSFKLTLNKVLLDELRIKVDNLNGRYILTSLYSKTRRGNIDGLFTAIINKDLSGTDIEKAVEFNDEFRALAKGDNSARMAINDYFLKHLVVKKDGGLLV
ncbi:MAG: hypothetical protein KA160_07260, partial [Lacibacter sp.]|nr:hypothetical protein [Lacibacter sp.]